MNIEELKSLALKAERQLAVLESQESQQQAELKQITLKLKLLGVDIGNVPHEIATLEAELAEVIEELKGTL